MAGRRRKKLGRAYISGLAGVCGGFCVRFSSGRSGEFARDHRGRLGFKGRAQKFFIFDEHQVFGHCLRDARNSAYFDCTISNQLRWQ